MKRITIILFSVVFAVFFIAGNGLSKEKMDTLHTYSSLPVEKGHEILEKAKNTDDVLDPVIAKYYTCLFFPKFMDNPNVYGRKLINMIPNIMNKEKYVMGAIVSNFMRLVFKDAGKPDAAKQMMGRLKMNLNAACKKYDDDRVYNAINSMTKFYEEYFDIPEDEVAKHSN